VKFGTEKLEWLGYPTVKNFEDTFIRFHIIHERNRHTHRQTQTHTQTPHDGKAELMHSIARQKLNTFE